MSSQNSTPWRLDWDDSLSIGIAEIDAEHQHFIQLINNLNQAIAGRMEMPEIKQRMRAILDDAAAHFAHEEALFLQSGLPNVAAHAQKHAQLSAILQLIMEHFEQGCPEYELIAAGLKIKALLIEHLLTEDMKYRRS